MQYTLTLCELYRQLRCLLVRWNQERLIVLRVTLSLFGLTIRDSLGYGCPRNKLLTFFHIQEVWNYLVHLDVSAENMSAGDATSSPGLGRRHPADSTLCQSAAALLDDNNSITLACNFCLPLATELCLFHQSEEKPHAINMGWRPGTSLHRVNMALAGDTTTVRC